jgi:hypothetical protein
MEKFTLLSAMASIMIGVYTLQRLTWLGIAFIGLGLYIFYRIFKTPTK